MAAKLFSSFIFAVCLFFGNKPVTKQIPSADLQFICMLHYTPEFRQNIKWTATELETARQHVAYIKRFMDEGKARLLGRTTNFYDPELFGILILDVSGLEEAKKIVEDDPIIKSKILQADIHPFTIVLEKNKGG